MSVNRKVTVPVGSSAAGTSSGGTCRRRRRSRPNPSSIATTPSSATMLHSRPAGEISASPEPVHSAAATATVMTPGFLARSAGRRPPGSGAPGPGVPTPESILVGFGRHPPGGRSPRRGRPPAYLFLAVALPPLRPAALCWAVVPPCSGSPPLPEALPPCLEASGELAILAARCLLVPF